MKVNKETAESSGIADSRALFMKNQRFTGNQER
jgi:hypothetical protein